MAKVIEVTYTFDGTIHCFYKCPGCNDPHAFSPKVHQWNGSRDNPTVTPSLLHSNPQGHHTCHSYITNGRIRFLGDCWHILKGQTVDLPELTEDDLPGREYATFDL